MDKTVIWAIDPFETETRPDRAVLKELQTWTQTAGLAIQPVHILGFSTAYELADESLGTDSRPLPSAEKAAQAYLADLGITNALPPKVILAPAYSRKREIQKILALAELYDSPMIVVSSHGRTGLERLALGSFSETLLHESKRPVLFLTHSHPKGAGRIQKILFPTDLSTSSKRAFQRFLPQAKTLNAEVILFFAVTLPSVALSPGGLYGSADAGIPENYFTNLKEWALGEGAEWIKEAAALEVPAKLIVQDEGVTNQIARLILKAAHDQNVDLIAMASVSGPFTSFVAGSVAREVFRAREFPVWVCGPKALEQPETSVPVSSLAADHSRLS